MKLLHLGTQSQSIHRFFHAPDLSMTVVECVMFGCLWKFIVSNTRNIVYRPRIPTIPEFPWRFQPTPPKRLVHDDNVKRGSMRPNILRITEPLHELTESNRKILSWLPKGFLADSLILFVPPVPCIL